MRIRRARARATPGGHERHECRRTPHPRKIRPFGAALRNAAVILMWMRYFATVTWSKRVAHLGSISRSSTVEVAIAPSSSRHCMAGRQSDRLDHWALQPGPCESASQESRDRWAKGSEHRIGRAPGHRAHARRRVRLACGHRTARRPPHQSQRAARRFTEASRLRPAQRPRPLCVAR